MSDVSEWRWIRSGASGPAFNMALDEALLRIGPKRPVLRTYAWAPWTLSLGYFQPADRGWIEKTLEQGYGVVRRSTGGGAIFHGNELTYSIVCPVGTAGVPRDTIGAYEVLHGILATALERVGISAVLRGDRQLASDARTAEESFWCFYESTAFDLVDIDRKIVGSAQRRTGTAFLQHGSLPIGPNPFTPRAADARARYETMETALADALAKNLGVTVTPSVPTRGELTLANSLVTSRFGTNDWTWKR